MRALLQVLRRLVPDMLGVLGAGVLLDGIAQLSVPAAWISAGLILIAIAIMIAMHEEAGR